MVDYIKIIKEYVIIVSKQILFDRFAAMPLLLDLVLIPNKNWLKMNNSTMPITSNKSL